MLGPSTFLVLWAGVLVVAGRVQDVAVPDVPWPVEAASKPFQELGNRAYLAAWLGLSERAAATPDLGDAASLVPDFLGTIAPWIGEHAAALEQRAKLMDVLGTPRARSGRAPPTSRAGAPSPRSTRCCGSRAIVASSCSTKSTCRRASARSCTCCSRGLREAGFTHLACETLAEDRALNERGYPTMTSSYYAKDPLYGDLLRRADALGFTFAMYEAPPEEARPATRRHLAKRCHEPTRGRAGEEARDVARRSVGARRRVRGAASHLGSEARRTRRLDADGRCVRGTHGRRSTDGRPHRADRARPRHRRSPRVARSAGRRLLEGPARDAVRRERRRVQRIARFDRRNGVLPADAHGRRSARLARTRRAPQTRVAGARERGRLGSRADASDRRRRGGATRCRWIRSSSGPGTSACRCS
jgi:hypothetical protein